MYDRSQASQPVSYQISLKRTQNNVVGLDASTSSIRLTAEVVRFTSVFTKKDVAYVPGKFKVGPVEHRLGSVSYVAEGGITQYPVAGWYKWVLSGQIVPYFIVQSEWGWYQQVNGIYLAAPPVDNVRTAICLLGSAAKVAQPMVDIPVFLGELADTLKLLRRPLSLLGGKWRKFLRKPRMLPASRVPQYLGEKWLEARYGIIPLISDIEGGMEVFKQRNKTFGLELRYTSEAMRGLKTPVTTSVKSYYDGLFGGCWRQGRMREWTEYGVVAKTYYSYEMEQRLSPAQMLGLNFNRWANVTWELIPYSFVVDWFVNVGTWLEAVRPKPGIRHWGHTSGIKSTKIRICELDYVSFCDPSVSAFRSSVMVPKGNYTIKTTSYRRVLHDRLPEYPQVNWDFRSVNHAIDGLFLLLNNIKKR